MSSLPPNVRVQQIVVGLVNAVNKLKGFQPVRETYHSNRVLLEIYFPPVTLHYHTYTGMMLQVSLYYGGERYVTLWQKGIKPGTSKHPHKEDGGKICWYGGDRFLSMINHGKYDEAITWVIQGIATVTEGHWREGTAICATPGCIERTTRGGTRHCNAHTPRCAECDNFVWSHHRIGLVDGMLLCDTCRYTSTCQGCRLSVRVKVSVKARYSPRYRWGEYYHPECAAKCSKCEQLWDKKLVKEHDMCPECYLEEQKKNEQEQKAKMVAQPTIDQYIEGAEVVTSDGTVIRKVKSASRRKAIRTTGTP